MYEIRFYYKNDDRRAKENIAWHTYDFYESYKEAYSDLKNLIKHFKEIKLDEVIFAPSVPEEKLEPFVLFLAEEGKSLATIV